MEKNLRKKEKEFYIELLDDIESDKKILQKLHKKINKEISDMNQEKLKINKMRYGKDK